MPKPSDRFRDTPHDSDAGRFETILELLDEMDAKIEDLIQRRMRKCCTCGLPIDLDKGQWVGSQRGERTDYYHSGCA